MDYAIGIDIGGTKTAIGIVDEKGDIVSHSIIPTDLTIVPEQMIENIISEFSHLLSRHSLTADQILGIGICAPGPLDSKKGLITCPPNLPNWRDFPIVEQMKKRFTGLILLENDANAATLSEKWVGAAQDSDHFAYITISTGIGAGLFLNGDLFTGDKGNAGELGHIPVDPTKGTCVCGQKGCLEWIASGTAIARRGSEVMGIELTTKEVFDLNDEKHPKIVSLIDDVYTSIGMGCVTLINLFDPEKIVIGGGVSQVGDPLFSAVQDYVSQYALNPSGRKVQVVPALLKKQIGIIGAAALIFHYRKDDVTCKLTQ
jgi:glucokinase